MKPGLSTLLAVAALAAAPAFAIAQDKPAAKAGKGGSEVHRMMMSSAKQSQSMKSSGDADHDFLTMMRHHHQAGIRMAEAQLRHGKNEEVKSLARKIIDGQKEELAELDKLAKQHQPAGTGSSTRSPGK